MIAILLCPSTSMGSGSANVLVILAVADNTRAHGRAVTLVVAVVFVALCT